MALSLSSRAGLSWKRMLVVLIAIPAVIVALLAMHLLLSGSPTPDAHAATESGSLFGSAAAESPLVAVFQGDATAQENCVDPCSPPHDERVMACVLALLGSAFLILFYCSRGATFLPPRFWCGVGPSAFASYAFYQPNLTCFSSRAIRRIPHAEE